MQLVTGKRIITTPSNFAFSIDNDSRIWKLTTQLLLINKAIQKLT